MANRISSTISYIKSKVAPRKQSDNSSSGGVNLSDPKSISVRRIGFKSGDVDETDFVPPEIDFASITAAYDTDGYVRQGVDKYIDLLWKEGYDIYGKNSNAVDYLKTRFHYMSLATNTPFEQFLYDISEELIKYHNVIIGKSRMNNPAQVPPGVSLVGIGGQQPVAGYFVLNCSTFSARRDQYGTIRGWLQTSEDEAREKRFRPEDIVHIYYRREKGDLWAKPFLLPVLDDVRALREAEENILRMMWRGVFPFQHIKVGTDEMPASQKDIEDVEDNVMRMDREGGLVTSHAVDIKAIASDKIIDAAPYLKYFEERVFTGIGIPGIMFGRGNTANRSTGDNMATEVADRVRAYQKVFEMFFNNNIVNELLMEGGFDPVLREEDRVVFRFKENDVDRQHKVQNQAVFLYEHHAISEDEMRDMIGKDSIDETDVEVREKMYLNVVQSNQGGESSNKESENKNQPENQHGKKPNAKKETNELALTQKRMSDLKDKVLMFLGDYEEKTKDKEFFDEVSCKADFEERTKNAIGEAFEDICSINSVVQNKDENTARVYKSVLNSIYSHIIKSMGVYNNMTDKKDVIVSVFDIHSEDILKNKR